MRSTADLIKELGREAKRFTRVALIVGFEEHTQFLFHREDSALEEELNALLEEGGEPIGIAAVVVTKSQSDSDPTKKRVELSTWPLVGYEGESWVREYLVALSASIREQFVQRGAKAGGISISKRDFLQ